MATGSLFGQASNSSGKNAEPAKPVVFDTVPPIDDIVSRHLTEESRVLPYTSISEADILWEKRIWHVIDTREKMNLPLAYPEASLFSAIKSGIEDGSIRTFADDGFQRVLSPQEVHATMVSTDTLFDFGPEPSAEPFEIVRNDMDPEAIKRYRVKEVWFFNKETSSLEVRILGIAPLIDIYDDYTGSFKYEKPLFWIYYPECREKLSQHTVYNEGNDASLHTWEDYFEMRLFSSNIYKEKDIRSRRLFDYLSRGLDQLIKAEQIKQDIFNFEHDSWSY